jgi:hypothetical protein
VIEPPPRRPWYRRKRAWAALALWLLVVPYVSAYAVLVRPVDVGFGAVIVVAVYPLPALGPLFAPAEWVDRRIRPEVWAGTFDAASD